MKKLTIAALAFLTIANPIVSVPPETEAQARPQSQSRVSRLRVVYPSVSPTYSAAWLAQEGGYLKEQGLDVEYVYISSGSRVIQAMLAGEAPIVFSGGRAKNAKPEEFIDDQIVCDLEREGYFSSRGKK